MNAASRAGGGAPASNATDEADTAGDAAAFAVFHRAATAARAGVGVLRPALPAVAELAHVQGLALTLDPDPTDDAARAFFRDHFIPQRIGADAFFTGYYEPIVDGALEPSAAFQAPILARPADLHTFAADAPRPGWASAMAAARVMPDGGLVPYPDRAAIEADADRYTAVVWLRDWVEVFLIQVQGSARVRLPDGRTLRLTYAGRNGHPYTSIGRILVDSGAMAADAMSLDRLKAWLRANGQAPGDAGRAVMQRNASYVFFDGAIDDGGAGPIGGAGLPLTPLVSIAIDRTRWSYGLPFRVEATLPWGDETPTPLRRLMIAQDTGSAIVGPARVDLFMGSGAAAGRIAGNIRHHGALTVLLPRPAAP